MIRPTLAQTLTALADGACPLHPGLSVIEAEIDLPLVVTMEHGPDGPIFIAHPPYSAFSSGFDPVAHRARLSLGESVRTDDPAIAAAPEGALSNATRPAGTDEAT